VAKDVFVSLCMIVKNEERYLARALESARPLADEIIVVDTGSSDATVAIAKRHGARVFRFEWVDDFAAARNASLRPARGEWIVVLDADEFFAPGHAERLRRMLEQAAPTVAGYRVYQTNLADDQGGAVIDKSTTIRVFRNRAHHRYQYPIHEQIVDSLRDGTVEPSDVELLHSGFIQSVAQERGKAERNRTLLERFLASLPEGHPHRPYLHMQLGTEYRRSGDNERAFAEICLALENLETIARVPYNRAFGTVVVNHYGFLAITRGQPALAHAAAQRAIDCGLDTPSMWFMRGWAAVEEGRTAEGVRDLLWSIAVAEQGTGREDFVSPTEMEQAWYLATHSLLRAGALPAAAAMAVHALRWAPESDRFLAVASALAEVGGGELRPFIASRVPAAAAPGLAQRALGEGRLETAAALAQRLGQLGDPGGRVVAAKVALRRGDWADAAALLREAYAEPATRAEVAGVWAVCLMALGHPLGERLAVLEAEPDTARRALLAEMVGGPVRSPKPPPDAYAAVEAQLRSFGFKATAGGAGTGTGEESA
jgi:glycosyltransferase involved in cell wall biosynthesis